MTRKNFKELKATIKSKNQLINVLKKQIKNSKETLKFALENHKEVLRIELKNHNAVEHQLRSQLDNIQNDLIEFKRKKWYQFIERK